MPWFQQVPRPTVEVEKCGPCPQSLSRRLACCWRMVERGRRLRKRTRGICDRVSRYCSSHFWSPRRSAAGVPGSCRFKRLPRLQGIGSVRVHDPVPPPVEVLTNGPAVVEGSVVADHVDPAVRPQTPAKIVEMSQKPLRVPPRAGWAEQQRVGTPHQRSGQITLDVVAGGDHFGVLSLGHPHRADLGIEVHVHFVLEHGRFVVRRRRQQRLDSTLPPPLSSLVSRECGDLSRLSGVSIG
jgi:hypothetical protein